MMGVESMRMFSTPCMASCMDICMALTPTLMMLLSDLSVPTGASVMRPLSVVARTSVVKAKMGRAVSVMRVAGMS